MTKSKAAHFPATGELALQLVDVRKKLGGCEILRGVNLRLEHGEVMLLIGPNGAGKSTLFNVISGLTAADHGQIRLYGQAIQGLSSERIYRQGLSRSFQINQLFTQQSVIDNMLLANLWRSGCRYAFWQGMSRWQSARTQAYVMLERLGLLQLANTAACHLSYAQQRLLELGMCLIGESPVILLDEPTAGMSRAETATIVNLIRELCKGKTLLMIEHDMNVVFELADRIAVLVYGEVLACDLPHRIRQNPAVQQAYLGTSPAPITRGEQ